MRLAWLCYSYKYDEEDEEHIEVKFSEPDSYLYEKIVQVVLAEVNNED
jgi:hypothetical protein